METLNMAAQCSQHPRLQRASRCRVAQPRPFRSLPSHCLRPTFCRTAATDALTFEELLAAGEVRLLFLTGQVGEKEAWTASWLYLRFTCFERCQNSGTQPPALAYPVAVAATPYILGCLPRAVAPLWAGCEWAAGWSLFLVP